MSRVRERIERRAAGLAKELSFKMVVKG